MSTHYEMICATETGRVRANNEDSIRIVPQFKFAVLADGMGGHKAGDIASRMAVNSLCDFVEEQQLVGNNSNYSVDLDLSGALRKGFASANGEIYANSQQLMHCEGMGTTLLATAFDANRVHIGHIGDSRLYRFAQGELHQLTVDHTLAAELIRENPKQNIPHYSHHVLRKALGIEQSCEPDYFSYTVSGDEIFLLCTDGLNGVVNDNDIATIISLRGSDPEYCIESLIEEALRNGGPDNISVILVYTSKQ